MMEKIWKSGHHYNNWKLIHRYEADGSITRRWEPKSAEVSALKHPVVKTDGSEPLESLAEDIYHCFCFTGSDEVHSRELYREIYETKLPEGTVLRPEHASTISDATPGDPSTPDEAYPKTYHELFGHFGHCPDGRKIDNYTVWQIMDSMHLSIVVRGNNIYYGYYR